MSPAEFTTLFKEAFTESTPLPLAFWYSETPINPIPKVNGCLFQALSQVRNGNPISFDNLTIGCNGGRLYTGFCNGIPEHIPNFVSGKERYKQSPQMVIDYINSLGELKAPHPYLNFARIDCIDTFSHIEGLIFFATPDILSGLLTWCFFDNNSPDAVATLFGSGCASIIACTTNENHSHGTRTFLGCFDVSVRPHLGQNELSYAIPKSRLDTMLKTFTQSCLFNTPAWSRLQSRID